jgi:hypothetical protein
LCDSLQLQSPLLDSGLVRFCRGFI